MGHTSGLPLAAPLGVKLNRSEAGVRKASNRSLTMA
jgi:hypothetical protein